MTTLEQTYSAVNGASGIALNLWGIGNPNGVVTAPFASKFDEYDADNNLVAQWTKKTNFGNTGWI